MSFYMNSQGAKVDGSAENAHTRDLFSIIPNNTKAQAEITKFELYEKDNFKYYQIQWTLVDGEFAQFSVRQKIYCFDNNQEKADRAKNMLVRIFKLLNYTPTHSEAPKTHELKLLTGKKLGIVIRQYHMQSDDGKSYEGNFVSEVHSIDDQWVSQSGKFIEYKLKQNSRTQNNAQDILDDDIPF